MLRRLILVMLLALPFFTLNVFVGSVQSQEAELPPLTEPGPYSVRIVPMTFVDESRENWTLDTLIWYPADKTQGTPNPDTPIMDDAPPDRSGAPYPLILYSHGWTNNSGELMDVKVHLASHGYVVVSPYHHDTNPGLHELVDRPLDLMFLLDELASITEGDLAGMIDTDNIGLMGFSQGGTAVLQMLGLLRDPIEYERWCAEHSDITSSDCIDASYLADIAVYRAHLGLPNMHDGRWQPFGDERIHAVIAMAPGGFPLTTEDMLASVTTPTMLVQGTKDSTCDYQLNSVYIYNHLGTDDRYLVSLVRAGHLSLSNKVSEVQHFATAFFDLYLKNNQGMAAYLTKERAETWRNVVWGPYEAE